MATNTPRAEPVGASRWALPTFVVLVALVLQMKGSRVPVIGHGWARLDPNFVPVDMNPYIRREIDRPDVRLFNDANLGGYLIYHAPSVKIFMDDRCELYGDEWIKHYSDTLGLPPEELGKEFERWAGLYLFTHAFFQTNPPEKEKSSLERYLGSHPERWREVARGSRAVVFERVK